MTAKHEARPALKKRQRLFAGRTAIARCKTAEQIRLILDIYKRSFRLKQDPQYPAMGWLSAGIVLLKTPPNRLPSTSWLCLASLVFVFISLPEWPKSPKCLRMTKLVFPKSLKSRSLGSLRWSLSCACVVLCCLETPSRTGERPCGSRRGHKAPPLDMPSLGYPEGQPSWFELT